MSVLLVAKKWLKGLALLNSDLRVYMALIMAFIAALELFETWVCLGGFLLALLFGTFWGILFFQGFLSKSWDKISVCFI